MQTEYRPNNITELHRDIRHWLTNNIKNGHDFRVWGQDGSVSVLAIHDIMPIVDFAQKNDIEGCYLVPLIAHAWKNSPAPVFVIYDMVDPNAVPFMALDTMEQVNDRLKKMPEGTTFETFKFSSPLTLKL